MSEWVRVIFSGDVDQETDLCPQCGDCYSDCPCPGPTQEDEFEYKTVSGILYARPRACTDSP
mgnify:CR=1 FL=1